VSIVDEPVSVAFPALGTTASALVTNPAARVAANRFLRDDLDDVDLACSRFRADSEIRAVERAAGRTVAVSPLLGDALDAALRAAELTGGLVDPTVGISLEALGYDRDFALLAPAGPVEQVPAPGWWRLGWDSRRRELVVPRGVRIDLGATAKAFAADRSARRIADALGCGVLVNLGGDVAAAGPAPDGGWRVTIADDHREMSGPVVTIIDGGLATSGTARRNWRRGPDTVHHLVDPRTGTPAAGGWRTVSVAAASCVDANTASTAAIVLGPGAPAWLAARGLPARLVAVDAAVRTVAGWPTDSGAN
jgi:thiamine biosynthesis lipoprotein